jgi:membrane protease YdiL (CAAX protease family)
VIEIIQLLADVLIKSWRLWAGVLVGSMVGFIVWAFVPGLSRTAVGVVCIALGFIGGLLWGWIAERRGEQV